MSHLLGSWTEVLDFSYLLQGPVSISDKTSYCKISWSLEAARLVFIIVRSLWNLIGTSAALLPMCLSNFKAMRKLKLSISRFRDFTRSNDKTSYRILKWGPGYLESVVHPRNNTASHVWALNFTLECGHSGYRLRCVVRVDNAIHRNYEAKDEVYIRFCGMLMLSKLPCHTLFETQLVYLREYGNFLSVGLAMIEILATDD